MSTALVTVPTKHQISTAQMNPLVIQPSGYRDPLAVGRRAPGSPRCPPCPSTTASAPSAPRGVLGGTLDLSCP